uniref:Uncharacterized protein n=1 Tax=Leersia perrieri TaxID=77586 RepID=A0A0D9W3G2_9ORYZ
MKHIVPLQNINVGMSEEERSGKEHHHLDGTWVVDIEEAIKASGKETVAAAAVQQRKTGSCIYRVPQRMRSLGKEAYSPQVVSFGPLHHGAAALQPMEEHKRRALLHFLRRACRPLRYFVAAIEGVAEQLEGMYDAEAMPAEWRRVEGRLVDSASFVRLMVMDGCFMLEVVRAATARAHNDYEKDDPVFGWHGIVNTMPYVRRDMLLLENQLPLLVLHKLVTVESGQPDPGGHTINKHVLRFLSPSTTTEFIENTVLKGLHPLDLFRWSRVYEETTEVVTTQASAKGGVMDDDGVPSRPRCDISAMALSDAGIHLKKLQSKKIGDIRLEGRVLYLRTLTIDELTEPIFANLIAFERVHVGLDWPFRSTSYLFFMSKLIKSAEDVEYLCAKGIIMNALGDDKKAAEVLSHLSADLHVYPPKDGNRLATVHMQMEQHCQKKWNIWRTHIARKYFRNPWAPFSLAGSVFFLSITVASNIHNVLRHR